MRFVTLNPFVIQVGRMRPSEDLALEQTTFAQKLACFQRNNFQDIELFYYQN